MNHPIVNALFATRAIRVCPPGEPFWYTSGLFGPYYVNTHFLYGDEASAKDLLTKIEHAAADPLTFPTAIAAETNRRYHENEIYRLVMDDCVRAVEGLKFDLISGGERRDFFFSIQLAKLLKLPHLSIFKDGSTVYTTADGESTRGEDSPVVGKKALHVVDLVTQASSYIRMWLPVLNSLRIEISDTLAVVDRDQDGSSILEQQGVRLISLAVVSTSLFADALAAGLIDERQMALIEGYTRDPIAFVKDFVAENPDFLHAEIAKGGKNKERAERLLESDYLI
ncbi:MAG: orotate phosphoribosyltransferase [Fastidiosipilaceae bacterium]|jgi:orotate phosphoribosyltransferase